MGWNSYCSHGGICELDAGHEGLHDSRYCQWSDAQALTREAADAVLTKRPGGDILVGLWDLFDPRGEGRTSHDAT